MIYGFVLSLKRALRSIYIPAFLVIMAVAFFLAPMLGHEESMPPAGVCDLDSSEASVRVWAYLLRNGFELCNDEEILRERISRGEYDCGVIIPAGFGEMMQAAELDEAIVFIDSPLSYSPELYRNHVGAAIFGEVAPYISAKSLVGTGINAERMLAKYREMSGDGANFSFVLETANAVEITDNGRARTYVLGAASLFIFAFMMYAVCDILDGDIGALSHRIGMKKTVLYTVIPGMSVRVFGVWAVTLLAALISKLFADDGVLFALIPAIFVYTLLLAAFGILLVAIFMNTGRIQIFTFFMLVMSLVFCPIYIDLALVASWLEGFRYILPPYWLWLCADKPFMIAVTVAAVPAAHGVLYARFQARTRRRSP